MPGRDCHRSVTSLYNSCRGAPDESTRRAGRSLRPVGKGYETGLVAERNARGRKTAESNTGLGRPQAKTHRIPGS